MVHKPLKIKLHPTDESLWVYLGTPDNVKEEFQKADFTMDTYGCFFKNTNRKGRMTYVVYLSIWNLPLLVHELTHAIDFFSEDMEITSKEIRAYYMDYVFSIICNKFNKFAKE
jgi:hypothetical protein